MYAQSLRATGPRAEVMDIEQITNAHVTSAMYYFVATATTPIV